MKYVLFDFIHDTIQICHLLWAKIILLHCRGNKAIHIWVDELSAAGRTAHTNTKKPDKCPRLTKSWQRSAWSPSQTLTAATKLRSSDLAFVLPGGISLSTSYDTDHSAPSTGYEWSPAMETFERAGFHTECSLAVWSSPLRLEPLGSSPHPCFGKNIYFWYL